MSSLISKGYTPCEYIESSGTQYIDTGFKPNQDTQLILDAEPFTVTSSKYIYGCRTSSYDVNFGILLTTSNYRSDYGSSKVALSSLTDQYKRYIFNQNKNICTIGDITVTNTVQTFQSQFSIYICAVNQGGTASYFSNVKIFSCRIYDNGTLIRDFKPCRNSSGVYGLFDEVNDVFYTTPSGSFTGNVAETSIKLSQSFRRRLLLASNNNQPVGYEKQYFTIEALESGSISWENSTSDSRINTIYYSKNGGSWIGSTENSSVTVVSGDKIRFKMVQSQKYQTTIGFDGTARFNVYGNIMSLIYGDDFVDNNTLFDDTFRDLFGDCQSIVDASNLILPATSVPEYGYYEMFYNCTSLTAAPELPATSVAPQAYQTMFYGCTNLIKAPSKLPATSTGSYCYAHMFYNCTSLTTAPSEISAEELANYVCDSMFYNCTLLTTAPEILATYTAGYCFREMFYNCKNLIKAPSKLYVNVMMSYECEYMFYGCTSLTTAPELPATKLYGYCCRSMFEGCTSLTTAPMLPATTLASSCYENMFRSCTSLTTAPALPATTLADSCYYGMFSSCKSLVNAPELPVTTLTPQCYCEMFRGCTSLTTAPMLPATTLASSCYSNMFQDCNKLNSITMLATSISATNCLNYWVSDVASTGIFVKHFSMTSLETGIHGIPEGWTVKNSDGSPVTGGGSSGGGSTTASISWAVQTGSWTEGSNSSAKDGKQFTSVSPGSSGSTRIRCTFSGVTSITFNCIYYGESNYDYLTVGALDSTCTRDSYGTTLKGTSHTQRDITFSCNSSTHYVEFCYSKDGSVDTSSDCAVVYIKNYS